MTSMIEKVARAMCITEGGDPDCVLTDPNLAHVADTGHKPLWTNFIVSAKAAIQAMAEPTEAMVKAGDCASFNAHSPSRATFEAMLQAALEEGRESADEIERLILLCSKRMLDAAELQGEIEQLRKQYQECIHDLQDWGAYASPFFQEKHDFHGCIAQHEANLKEPGDE